MTEDTAAWDAEAEEVFKCPDCPGPTVVHSEIHGRIRRIRLWQWHAKTCPNRNGRLRWGTAAALDVGLLTEVADGPQPTPVE